MFDSCEKNDKIARLKISKSSSYLSLVEYKNDKKKIV